MATNKTANAVQLTQDEKAMAAELTKKLTERFQERLQARVQRELDKQKKRGEVDSAVSGLKEEIAKYQKIRKDAYAKVRELRKQVRTIKEELKSQ